MSSIWKFVQQPLFRIDGAEVTFERRGFEATAPCAQSHLEQIGTSFLHGYHQAVDTGNSLMLAQILSQVEPEYRGFSFEGAAMGLGLLDALSFPSRPRWNAFLEDTGKSHRYVIHVGLGWVVARIPWLRSRSEQFISKLDPLLKWLVMDGYGFHEGYFHWKKWSPAAGRRPQFSGYAARAFDQGLGRCLWFVGGADAGRVSQLIAAFAPDRQPDLWSGVGLACTYAGKPDLQALHLLMENAGPQIIHFQQGVTFGAEARELGGIQTEHTNQTCKIVCGMSSAEAAQVTYAALPTTASDHNQTPAYETWRSQIRDILAQEIPSCT